jgi:hypothetical protein
MRRELSTELRAAARRSLAASLALIPQIQREATERSASPAAHSTNQARRLADEGSAIRGRVHAVVRPTQGSGLKPLRSQHAASSRL